MCASTSINEGAYLEWFYGSEKSLPSSFAKTDESFVIDQPQELLPYGAVYVNLDRRFDLSVSVDMDQRMGLLGRGLLLWKGRRHPPLILAHKDRFYGVDQLLQFSACVGVCFNLDRRMT